jgi:hypothetical protein
MSASPQSAQRVCPNCLPITFCGCWDQNKHSTRWWGATFPGITEPFTGPFPILRHRPEPPRACDPCVCRYKEGQEGRRMGPVPGRALPQAGGHAQRAGASVHGLCQRRSVVSGCHVLVPPNIRSSFVSGVTDSDSCPPFTMLFSGLSTQLGVRPTSLPVIYSM